jgi:uncharacterized protein (DUF2252 family)
MLQSPFAFYRGTAAVMAADLAHTPASGLRVQACGDAHLSNFGGFATPERELIFDVNDLDETLPAPWEWDVKRLTVSVVLAGRHLQLSQSASARAAVATARSYRKRMAEYAFMKALDVWYDKIDVIRYLENLPDEEARARAAQRIEEARVRTVPEHDFRSWPSAPARSRLDNLPLLSTPQQREASTGVVEDALVLCRESLPEHARVLCGPVSSPGDGDEGRGRR